jgi:hypothetical protein
MNEISYQGYLIRPVPFPLAAGGWGIEVHIERHRENSVSERVYNSDKTFRTEDEARAHCIHFGKQIVDGKIKGLSVEGL